MTEIFFYHNAQDRILAMAHLITRAVAQKKALVVFAPNTALADRLDRQLWVAPSIGFTPHVREDSPLASVTPVVIARTLEGVDHSERLFNLSSDVPPSFARFHSLIEVVGQQEQDRQEGRARVKFYKDRGYAIRYFDLAAK